MKVEHIVLLFPFWIKAFLMTLAFELPVFIAIGKRAMKKVRRVSTVRLALGGALGTCITHPLLWFAWPLAVRDYTLYLITGELLVAAIESGTFYLALKGIRFRDAAVASVVANGVSFGLGALLQSLIY